MKKLNNIANLVTILLNIIICVVFQSIVLLDSSSLNAFADNVQQKTFYVDAVNGDDNNEGTLSKPFKTLNTALKVVSDRVNDGIYSDKIYLRSGEYRNDGFSNAKREYTLYNVNMKGTATDLSVISAMPCEPNTSGCVQMKSGEWYEKVVFDDGYTIPSGMWTKYNDDIWKADPGYLNYKFGSNPLSRKSFAFKAGTNSNLLATGPRMVLQDGEPLLWKDPWPDYNPLKDTYVSDPIVDPSAVLTGPGIRTYDQVNGILYVWPFGNVDPNTVIMESWKGTTSDGRFRHMFDGSMEYVHVKGIEFRLVGGLFCPKATDENVANTILNYLTWEDNRFTYGQQVFFNDIPDHTKINTIRGGWLVRNNVFYRTSREVFQIWGDNHVIEYNEIIEHAGPWAGGNSGFGIFNLKHARNSTVRFNYIQNLGNEWKQGNGILFEIDSEQKDQNGDCVFEGATIEYNMFGNFGAGAGVYLGRGGCRMNDIIIRNNIFYVNPEIIDNRNAFGIVITSPQNNLQIHNNVFYEQRKAIKVVDGRSGMNLESMVNNISVEDNIFFKSNFGGGGVIHPRLVNVATIDRNIFFGNGGIAPGTNQINADPLFQDSEKFNFTLEEDSPAIQPGADIGVYDFGEPALFGTEWWLLNIQGD